MSVCQKAVAWQISLKVFEELQHVELEPDRISYNIILNSCEKGHWDFFGPDQFVVLRRRKKTSRKKQTDQSLTLKIREKHINYHPTLGKNIIFKSAFG